MPTIRLTDARQEALRSLLCLDPDPGDPPTVRRVLSAIKRLIQCDRIGVSTVDPAGWVVGSVSMPPWPDPSLPYIGATPVALGVRHLLDDPAERHALARRGVRDGLVLAYPEGCHHVVGLRLDRQRCPFSETDAALLRTVAPRVQVLLRSDLHARPGAPLTLQETRVLQLVAAGLSNADVAVRLSVAPSTVCKHLEHVFRKLGVSNRLAPVRALEGATRTGSVASRRDRDYA